MSCIPKLIQLKGDKKFLRIHPNSVMESAGNFEGYDFLITMNRMGHRCGYVAIPSTHPLACYAGTYDAPVDVHGCVTFCEKPTNFLSNVLKQTCDDVWIGFDCGHYEDSPDVEKIREYYPEVGIEELSVIERFVQFGTIKSNQFVVDECMYLILQIKCFENH